MPSLPSRFLEHGDVRLDAFLMHQPSEVLGWAVGAVGRQPLWIEAEAVLGALDHGARGTDLRLTDGAAWLDIDDDGMVEVDQVVGGIGEEGVPLVRARPLGCRVRLGHELGFTSLAAPQAASSSVSRYSRTERRVLAIASQSTSSLPSAERCLLASALIRLASVAKPSPPTSPSAMQRATVASNSSRKGRCRESGHGGSSRRSSGRAHRPPARAGRTSDRRG